MILPNGTIVQCKDDRVTLTKHKGTKSEVRVSILCDDIYKIHDFALMQKCKAAGIALPIDKTFPGGVEPSGVLR